MDGFRNFGFLLKDLTKLYVRRFEHHAAHLGMTIAQCKALAKLAQNEGASQARLAELTEIDPMAMVRILDRMEADGWVERRPDPADRRARRLYLKSKAAPLIDAIWRLADTTRAEAFAGLSKEEREVLIGLLERLHANFSALAGAPAQAAAAGDTRSKKALVPKSRSRTKAAKRTGPASARPA